MDDQYNEADSDFDDQYNEGDWDFENMTLPSDFPSTSAKLMIWKLISLLNNKPSPIIKAWVHSKRFFSLEKYKELEETEGIRMKSLELRIETEQDSADAKQAVDIAILETIIEWFKTRKGQGAGGLLVLIASDKGYYRLLEQIQSTDGFDVVLIYRTLAVGEILVTIPYRGIVEWNKLLRDYMRNNSVELTGQKGDWLDQEIFDGIIMAKAKEQVDKYKQFISKTPELGLVQELINQRKRQQRQRPRPGKPKTDEELAEADAIRLAKNKRKKARNRANKRARQTNVQEGEAGANAKLKVQEETQLEMELDPDDVFRDEDEDHESEFFQEKEASKEFVVYLIDASPKMFSSTCPSEEDKQESHFHIAVSCIAESLKAHIINRSNDEIAICFFNTREKKNLQDLNGVYVFNVPERDSIDRPTARLFKEFDLIEESFDKDIGSQNGIVSDSRENSLYSALWVAQALLRKGSSKTADKRMFLVTNEDDPFGKMRISVKEDMTRMTLQRAKDAQDLGISVELIPFSQPDKQFDITLFYKDLIGLGIDKLTEFMPSVGRKLEDIGDQLKKLRDESKKQSRDSNMELWFEDLTQLSLPIFRTVILSMKSGDLSSDIIESCLICYAKKHIPGILRSNRKPPSSSSTAVSENEQRELLETITSNLPLDKSSISSTTRFLFGLLRTAIILNASAACRDLLERKIGSQLERATLDDLLVPSYSYLNETLYDVDLVERILGHFLDTLEQSNTAIVEADGRSPSLMLVGKLIDGFLAEIASDANLKSDKFYNLAISLPDQARLYDDGLYRAVDVYLKAHPWVSEAEREKICGVMDCQKLTLEACTHAAQNERLPLRAVVQVLFFEQLQLRHAIAGTLLAAQSPSPSQSPRPSATAALRNLTMTETVTEEDGDEVKGEGQVDAGKWKKTVRENQVLRLDMDTMRTRVHRLERECSNMKKVIAKIGKEGSSPATTTDRPRSWSITKKFGCKFKTQVCDSHEATMVDHRSRRS